MEYEPAQQSSCCVHKNGRFVATVNCCSCNTSSHLSCRVRYHSTGEFSNNSRFRGVRVTMGRKRIALIFVIALAVVIVAGALAWKRRTGRPAAVLSTAVLVDGQYIDCIQTTSSFGEPCKVYDGTSGKLVDTNPNPFSIRLSAFSKQQGGSPTDCGKTSTRAPAAKVAACVQEAFRSHSPFTGPVHYRLRRFHIRLWNSWRCRR